MYFFSAMLVELLKKGHPTNFGQKLTKLGIRKYLDPQKKSSKKFVAKIDKTGVRKSVFPKKVV